MKPPDWGVNGLGFLPASLIQNKALSSRYLMSKVDERLDPS